MPKHKNTLKQPLLDNLDQPLANVEANRPSYERIGATLKNGLSDLTRTIRGTGYEPMLGDGEDQGTLASIRTTLKKAKESLKLNNSDNLREPLLHQEGKGKKNLRCP